jgi:hypothetical protein
VTPTDEVLENKADDRPWDVVDSAGRGNGSSSRKDDREAGGRWGENIFSVCVLCRVNHTYLR